MNQLLIPLAIGSWLVVGASSEATQVIQGNVMSREDAMDAGLAPRIQDLPYYLEADAGQTVYPESV